MSPHTRHARLLLDAAKARRTESSLTIFLMREARAGLRAAQGRDMRIALVSAKMDNIAVPKTWRVLDALGSRSSADYRRRTNRTDRSLQKVDEERQLTQRREGRRVIPFDPHRTGETVDHQRLGRRRRASKRNRRLFTCGVNGDRR